MWLHELNHIFTNPLSFLLLIAFIIASGWWFLQRSAHRKEPLISFSLFNHRSTITGNVVTILLGAFFSGYLFILSLLFQNNMNYSAAKAGVLLFPFSLLSAITGKFLFPLLLRKVSIAQAAITGMCLMATGAIMMMCCIYSGYALPLLLVSVACVTGCGMAISFPSLMVMSINKIPPAHHGLASSLSSTSYFFGGGIGLSVLGLSLQLSENVNTVSLLPVMILLLIACIGVIGLVISLSRKEERPSINTMKIS